MIAGTAMASDYENLDPHIKRLVNAAFYQPCREALESDLGNEILLTALLLNNRESTLAYSDEELAEKRSNVIRACQLFPDSNLYDLAKH